MGAAMAGVPLDDLMITIAATTSSVIHIENDGNAVSCRRAVYSRMKFGYPDFGGVGNRLLPKAKKQLSVHHG